MSEELSTRDLDACGEYLRSLVYGDERANATRALDRVSAPSAMTPVEFVRVLSSYRPPQALPVRDVPLTQHMGFAISLRDEAGIVAQLRDHREPSVDATLGMVLERTQVDTRLLEVFLLIGEDLFADVRLSRLLMPAIADALARAKNRMVLVGAGGIEPLGVLTDPSVPRAPIDNTDAASVRASLADALASLPAGHRQAPTARWAMHPTALARLDALGLVQYAPVQERVVPHVLDLPVTLDDSLPAGTLVAGDWQAYEWYTTPLTVQASRSGELFERRQVALRVGSYVDGRVVLPVAFIACEGLAL